MAKNDRQYSKRTQAINVGPVITGYGRLDLQRVFRIQRASPVFAYCHKGDPSEKPSALCPAPKTAEREFQRIAAKSPHLSIWPIIQIANHASVQHHITAK